MKKTWTATKNGDTTMKTRITLKSFSGAPFEVEVSRPASSNTQVPQRLLLRAAVPAGQAAETLLGLHPLVPVVLLTADTETFRLATLAQSGVVLRKPVMAGDLWKAICTRLAETEENRRWGSGVQLAFIRYMRAYHWVARASRGRGNGEVEVAA